MTIYFYPYNRFSSSVRELRKFFKERNVKTKSLDINANLNFKPNDLVINWGTSKVPYWGNKSFNYLNSPYSVYWTVNKLKFFEFVKEQNVDFIPTFWTSKEKVKQFLLENPKKKILARTILNGHSGAGIEIITNETTSIPEAPLYVLYIPKEKEFRVHIFKNEIVDIQEKRMRSKEERNMETFSTTIRNHHTGWVYCRNDITEPSDLRETALTAINILKLDFGAVDIIWNAKQNKCYILEINTAPGLVETSISIYGNKINDHYNSL